MSSLAATTQEALWATTALLQTDAWFTRKSISDSDFWVGILGFYLYDEGMKIRRN